MSPRRSFRGTRSLPKAEPFDPEAPVPMLPPTLDPDLSVLTPIGAQSIGRVGRAIVGLASGAVGIGEARWAAGMLENIAKELNRAADLGEFMRNKRWKRQAARVEESTA